MKSQITMKDMARHFGVSLNTIHKAIAGKPGVSEATRKKIMDYADANGYKLNAMASFLKRKNIKIAVCLPELDEDSKYFYSYIWQGYRKYMAEWGDLNIQVLEIPYKKGNLIETLRQLETECEGSDKLDGLLTAPPRDEAGIHVIRQFTDKGVCVVFVTGDNDECGRLGTVVGDYYAAGQIMAEQICNILKEKSRILLMAGDQYKDSHYLVAKGFHEYIRQSRAEYAIEDLFGYYESDRLDESIMQTLTRNPPDAVCCVFARGSAVLYKALKSSGMAGKLPVIANDVFDENVAALKDGTFTNLVFKDPYKQAYLAMKMLCEYLLKDMEPKDRVRKVEIVLIFKSNVNYYWKNIEDMQYLRL
ncbi:substrate-binding domain-containing protein [Lacrimispora sp.]|uniref:substrate-binding domain-containing protein n=1 Tax=Lacrimispora sp. TaxID=2719234 RepID=UPI00289920EE|nr:substrate-binding domain-containing protein [Lacrimispora sp.]